MDTPRQPHPPCSEAEGRVAIFCMAYWHIVLESKSLSLGFMGTANGGLTQRIPFNVVTALSGFAQRSFWYDELYAFLYSQSIVLGITCSSCCLFSFLRYTPSSYLHFRDRK